MAIQVYFNGTERTSVVQWQTLLWEQNLTHEVDMLSFSVFKFGTRTFAPAILDEVTMYDGGTKVFGGHIVDIKQTFDAADRLTYSVKVKDYTHYFDRLLVQEQYETKPLINILNDILNKYVNKTTRVEIADFETDSVWTGDGAADTTYYRIGSQGLRLTATASTTKTATQLLFLDLTANSLTTADYIECEIYVDNVTNLSSVTLKLGDATLANYFSYNVTGLVTGWNLFKVLKSAWTSNGSPSWASINREDIVVVANSSGTVAVTFDNYQAISATAYTRNNALTATQTVQNILFNLEYPSKSLQRLAQLFSWDWYIDQNRDVHLMPKFDESAPYNLTDTGGKYIPRSLVYSQNADQLRNSIFVSGGNYLQAAQTETFVDQVDGTNKILLLGYKYDIDTVTLTQNAVEKAVGIDNVDAYADNRGVSQTLYGTTQKNVGDVAGNYYQTQQLIAVTKARRSKIKIRVRKVGAPADNFQIQLVADTSNQANIGTNYSNVVTVAGGSLTTSFVETTFTLVEASANSLLFAKDLKYHIVATRSGAADPANYYQIDVYSDVYDGREYSGTSAPVWTSTGYSWYFIEVLSYEALYNEDEKTLTFNTAPAGGDTVSWTAQPKQKVLLQYVDNTSKATYGEFQFKVVDVTIESLTSAEQRAAQETLQWANSVVDMSYRTYQSGLYVGQTQNVQSDIRGLNSDVIIKKITARARTYAAFEYSVQCVTTKTMGLIYWLQSLIEAGNREQQVDKTQLLTKIEGVTESFTVTEAVATTSYTGKVWSNDAGTTTNKLTWTGGASDIWV